MNQLSQTLEYLSEEQPVESIGYLAENTHLFTHEEYITHGLIAAARQIDVNEGLDKNQTLNGDNMGRHEQALAHVVEVVMGNKDGELIDLSHVRQFLDENEPNELKWHLFHLENMTANALDTKVISASRVSESQDAACDVILSAQNYDLLGYRAGAFARDSINTQLDKQITTKVVFMSEATDEQLINYWTKIIMLNSDTSVFDFIEFEKKMKGVAEATFSKAIARSTNNHEQAQELSAAALALVRAGNYVRRSALKEVKTKDSEEFRALWSKLFMHFKDGVDSDKIESARVTLEEMLIIVPGAVTTISAKIIGLEHSDVIDLRKWKKEEKVGAAREKAINIHKRAQDKMFYLDGRFEGELDSIIEALVKEVKADDVFEIDATDNSDLSAYIRIMHIDGRNVVKKNLTEGVSSSGAGFIAEQSNGSVWDIKNFVELYTSGRAIRVGDYKKFIEWSQEQGLPVLATRHKKNNSYFDDAKMSKKNKPGALSPVTRLK